MPNKASHYDLAYCILRDVGLSEKDARREAWASQMVDVCTPEWLSGQFPGELLPPTQCESYGGLGLSGVSRSRDLDPRVWIWARFHFPWGHLGESERRAAIDRDTRLWAQLIRDGAPSYAIGIWLHRLLDGLTTHGFFTGHHCGKNRRPKPRGGWASPKQWLVALLAPPIGHAEYGGTVDDVDAEPWTAPDGKQVDNKWVWLRAVVTLGAPMNCSMVRSLAWIGQGSRSVEIPGFSPDLYSPRAFLACAARFDGPFYTGGAF